MKGTHSTLGAAAVPLASAAQGRSSAPLVRFWLGAFALWSLSHSAPNPDPFVAFDVLGREVGFCTQSACLYDRHGIWGPAWNVIYPHGPATDTGSWSLTQARRSMIDYEGLPGSWDRGDQLILDRFHFTQIWDDGFLQNAARGQSGGVLRGRFAGSQAKIILTRKHSASLDPNPSWILHLSSDTSIQMGQSDTILIQSQGDTTEWSLDLPNLGGWNLLDYVPTAYTHLLRPKTETRPLWITLGDSQVQGGNDPIIWARLWTQAGQARLLNLAVSGSLTTPALVSELQDCQGSQIALLWGANDFKSGNYPPLFKTAYENTLRQLRKQCPKAILWSIITLPMSSAWKSPFGVELQTYRTATLEAIQNQQDPNLHTLDTWGWWDPAVHTDDGLHPNAYGHQVLADSLRAAQMRLNLH